MAFARRTMGESDSDEVADRRLSRRACFPGTRDDVFELP